MTDYVIEDRAGRLVRVYSTGLERDDQTGRIIKPAPGVLIRADNAKDYQRKRQEKQARLLRKRITESARRGLPPGTGAGVRDSAEAFAEAGAMLFEQIVLESEAYPRDRLDAFMKLGVLAGVLPAPGADQTSQPGAGLVAAGAAMNAQTAGIIAQVLADVQRMQASNPDTVVIVPTSQPGAGASQPSPARPAALPAGTSPAQPAPAPASPADQTSASPASPAADQPAQPSRESQSGG